MWPPEVSDLLMEEYMGDNEDPQFLQVQFKEMMKDFTFEIFIFTKKERKYFH